MERLTLFDTEIHKEREKMMFLRDFQICMFISKTFIRTTIFMEKQSNDEF